MGWLMRFRALWGSCKSYHGFHPAPRPLCYRFLSATEAPRWNDYDRPEEFNFARDVLDYWTQKEKEGKRGPNPALWWVNDKGDEVKWSFRDLTDLSCRAANVFTQACGIQRGDSVAVILPPVPEWWLVVLGCIRAGIIFIPVTSQVKPNDILYRLTKSEAKSIVTTDILAPVVDSVVSQCPALKTKLLVSDHSHKGWLDFRSLIKSASPDHTCVKSKTWDPVAIFFTSGSTGFPKMSKHNHGLFLRFTFPSRSRLDFGFRGCLGIPWTTGTTAFIRHLSRFDPKVIVQTLFKYPITHYFTAPLAYRMILQEQFARFPTLEHCNTGGEVVLPEEQEKWKQKTGLHLYQMYGQSETGITTGCFRGMEVKPNSIGKAIPPFDVQIIDSKGNILPPNTEGYIGIRIKPTKPMGLFQCYENDPEKTAKVECGDFYNSGDRAIIDEEGYFYFVGRDDDIINTSGYRIGPAEVESALAEHPAVAEAAAVSSPDPVRGQVVKAFIVLTPEFLSHDPTQLTNELQQHVKLVTAPYKYPRKVEFVPELPKTVTGKINRNELRKREFGRK